MLYSVSHITTLEYAAPVRLAQFNVRLRPANWPGQIVSDYVLTIEPQPVQVTEGEGGYYVNETRFELREPITKLQIESRFTAECEALPFFLSEASGPSLTELRERAMTTPDLSALAPASYIFGSPIAMPEHDIAMWAGSFIEETMPVMEAGRALMHAIHEEFAYDAKATRTDTPPIEAFRNRHGVCQDFSHIMIIAARAYGIPAAYVSGYLRTLPPAGKERLVGADAMHAWVNLWCGEELGWVGFDPTNAALADTDHILIGMGRDYSDVAPLDGTFRGSSEQKMYYSVDVAPLD
ncbi:transglutaminase family protein [Novosphingobium mangrovi (ex Huang et al. 2023)]|uniref:Transglutaminase family protein n=1 Tax=Novosphingobium mangrovi (ex Huang et al. 2023) TaxID=2976432 RepID=A0ABT2I5Z9_9SPHN|nr:transglutaminase family protein [Novosphingobium mangrovi (ex Huang et al. 2023)]MCT2400250.1 transglutaminase family protein [Novosphingobium mangrovi (ex Huang et al. 2023)]